MPSLVFSSMLGNIRIEANEHTLLEVSLTQEDVSTGASSHPILTRTQQAIEAYLKGASQHFSLPVKLQGTPFEQDVYRALMAIPYGTTQSYQDIAKSIDRPRAARAVGQACGKNPLLLVVPCHRVVASDGSLGGFAHPLALKKKLLILEQNSSF